MEELEYFTACHYRNKDMNIMDFDDAVLSNMKEILAEALWTNRNVKPLVKARIRKREGWSFLTLEGRGELKGKFSLHHGITDEGMKEYDVHRILYSEFIKHLLTSHIQREIDDVKKKEKEDKP